MLRIMLTWSSQNVYFHYLCTKSAYQATDVFHHVGVYGGIGRNDNGMYMVVGCLGNRQYHYRQHKWGDLIGALLHRIPTKCCVCVGHKRRPQTSWHPGVHECHMDKQQELKNKCCSIWDNKFGVVQDF